MICIQILLCLLFIVLLNQRLDINNEDNIPAVISVDGANRSGSQILEQNAKNTTTQLSSSQPGAGAGRNTTPRSNSWPRIPIY